MRNWLFLHFRWKVRWAKWRMCQYALAKKGAGKKEWILRWECENYSFCSVLSFHNLFLFLDTLFGSIAYNGKSICEGRAKFNWKFNFDRTKQIAFSDYQITKKSNMKSKLRLNATNLSTCLQSRLLQILCYLQPEFRLVNHLCEIRHPFVDEVFW